MAPRGPCQSAHIARLPFLYEIIPEIEELSTEYRHIIYKNYRIIYRVEDRQVTVLRVIHAARLLHPALLEELPHVDK